MHESEVRLVERGTAPALAGVEPSAGDQRDDDISLIDLLNVVLRHRGLVLLCAVLSSLLLAVPRLFTARVYSSTAAFTTRSRSPAAPGLSGLAAQFGVAVPSGDATSSPAFFERLLRSREIMGRVVETRYADPDAPARTATLVEIYGLRRPDSLAARNLAVEVLGRSIRTETDPKTGVLTLSVTTRSPALSASVANRMIEEVGGFSLESRQSQASAERQFAERQLEEARASLRVAEDRLRDFEQHNRAFDLSPDLRLERDRLQRTIGLRQQVYTSLSQNYEQARLDEVRDTPSLLVIDPPEVPFRPDPRGVVKMAIMGVFVGTLFGVLLAFAKEYFAGLSRRGTRDVTELAQLRRSMMDDVMHPWRPITQRLRRDRASGDQSRPS